MLYFRAVPVYGTRLLVAYGFSVPISGMCVMGINSPQQKLHASAIPEQMSYMKCAKLPTLHTALLILRCTVL